MVGKISFKIHLATPNVLKIPIACSLAGPGGGKKGTRALNNLTLSDFLKKVFHYFSPPPKKQAMQKHHCVCVCACVYSTIHYYYPLF